jgi:hypothetical protein
MATSNTTQILLDTNKRTVIKRIGFFDINGGDEVQTVFINAKTLSNAMNANNLPYQSGNTVAAGFGTGLTISRVIASVDAEVGHLQLLWEGTSSSTIMALGVGSIDTNPQYQLPVITNTATNPTGNIAIKTVGTTANACYTVIIELHKNGQYYAAGQFQDPAAFNYPPYGNLNT